MSDFLGCSPVWSMSHAIRDIDNQGFRGRLTPVGSQLMANQKLFRHL